jgi:hypothetical protein
MRTSADPTSADVRDALRTSDSLSTAAGARPQLGHGGLSVTAFRLLRSEDVTV